MTDQLRVEEWKVINVFDIGDLAHKVFGQQLSGIDSAAATFYEISNDNIVGSIKVPTIVDPNDDYIADAGFIEKEKWEEYEKLFQDWLEGDKRPKDLIGALKYDRHQTPALYQVLNALHEKGHLEAGEYHIHVSW